MTIAEIEDTLIDTMKNLGIFKIVDSIGRKDRPIAMNYPSAFVYLKSETDTGIKPRPIKNLIFEIIIMNKNLRSEADAAKDTYSLMDSVMDAIQGKSLDIIDIEPFSCMGREIANYEDGIISYSLTFQTRHYLLVPVN